MRVLLVGGGCCAAGLLVGVGLVWAGLMYGGDTVVSM